MTKKTTKEFKKANDTNNIFCIDDKLLFYKNIKFLLDKNYIIHEECEQLLEQITEYYSTYSYSPSDTEGPTIKVVTELAKVLDVSIDMLMKENLELEYKKINKNEVELCKNIIKLEGSYLRWNKEKNDNVISIIEGSLKFRNIVPYDINNPLDETGATVLCADILGFTSILFIRYENIKDLQGRHLYELLAKKSENNMFTIASSHDINSDGEWLCSVFHHHYLEKLYKTSC